MIYVMPVVPKDHRLPSSTTSRPTSSNQMRELQDRTATMPWTMLRKTRGMTAAKPLPILIASKDAGDAYDRNCVQAECQRRTRRAWWTFHASLNNQDEDLDGTLAAERRRKQQPACAQGLSQSAQRGGNENLGLPPFQQDRRTTGINIALSNWR